MGLYWLHQIEMRIRSIFGGHKQCVMQRKVSIMSKKKLVKSNNRKICGVCGGIAEYFGIDPFIVRLIWGILAFAWGTSIFVYILLAFIMNVINAEPVGFRLNNGVKEEIYR